MGLYQRLGVVWFLCATIVVAAFVAGCGKKEMVVDEPREVLNVMVPTATPVPALPKAIRIPAGSRVPGDTAFRYLIREGDTLWDLAGNDPYLWPVIWRENRHWIPEPDWIDAGMEIRIPAEGSISPATAKWAREISYGWPKDPDPRVGE